LTPCAHVIPTAVLFAARRMVVQSSVPLVVLNGSVLRRNCLARWESYSASRGRVAENARGVVQGVVKGVTRASFGRRAPLTPQLKRASARRREEKVLRGLHDSAGGGCAPWLGTGTQS